MKKKILYAILIMSLIAVLPAFSGTYAITPEQLDDNNLSTNSVYEYDGNTIEILEQTDQSTDILLNDSYLLELEHNQTNVGVECIKNPTGISPEADDLVFDVDMEIDDDGQHLDIELPDLIMELDCSGENSDELNVTIYGFDVTHISYNTTDEYLLIDDGLNTIEMVGNTLIINEATGPYGFIMTRFNDTMWDIISPSGILVINFNEDLNAMYIEYSPVGVVYNGVVPFIPEPAPYHVDPIITIYYSGDGIVIGWDFVTLFISTNILIFTFVYITITWYWGAFLERLVILIYDITIIFYLALIELLIVIIYYTFEIKIYETQIVIVYEFIEIIFVFISLMIWEITFIFHFEFWFIQVLFSIHILNVILLPVRFVFVPVIVPVFIATIYYVPVYINNYIHIYVPYASPVLHIDVYNEDLAKPNHTIQYKVTDHAGDPVDDATVTVDYNGTQYIATFVSNGIYEVTLPASDETETIDVTAQKQWYPDGKLIYDLEVTWIDEIITTTITEAGVLPLIPIVASLACLAIGTIFVKRKK